MSGLTFVAAPRIGLAQWTRVLERAGSPAASAASALYSIPVRSGLDPAVALAFFCHESSYGTAGIARRTLNWGNLRRGSRQSGILSGFAVYRSWADSLADWCDLISNRYVARGLATVEAAVPVYAPSSDGNAPSRYIDQVRLLVQAWQVAERAGDVSMVVAVAVANVRSAPMFGKNVVGQMHRGDLVVGRVVDGAVVSGECRWLKLNGGGYMHLSTLSS